MSAALLDRYDVGPLPEAAPFGATVRGLTLAHLDDPSVRKGLTDLWIDKGVLLFRDCEDSAEMHVELSRCFGELQGQFFKDTWVDGKPELVEIKYTPDDGNQFELGGKLLGNILPWHTDAIYTRTINRGGMLKPVQLPSSGGMTGFIDKIGAYERLPDDLKARIAGLHVVYSVDINSATSKFGSAKDIRFVRGGTGYHSIQRKKFQFPRTLHPMVFEQAETGRKVLNVSPWFACGIFELGDEEGDDLLHEVISHCTAPANAYFHTWRMGDMVLWDNWRALHSATGVPPEETRILWRTTISGDYALGRLLSEATAKPDFDV